MSTVMRQQYRPLSTDEVNEVTDIKRMGQDLHDYLGRLGASRELSLAQTKIEEAVMWAVKHVTG